MRIAFFHELHFGGARRVVEEYAKVLKKDNKLDLFYVDNKKEEIENLFSESYFYGIKYQPYNGHNLFLKLYNDLIIPLKLYFLHKKIAAAIDRKKYDFVFVHPSQFTHAPFILRFIKTPLIYLSQEPLRISFDPHVNIKSDINKLKQYYERLLRKYKGFIDKSNIKKAQIIITNSKYSKSNIKKAYALNSIVCYLGVNQNIFKPRKITKIYDLIFVGDTIFMEGYDTFKQVLDLYKVVPSFYIVKPESGKYISDEELAKKYNQSKVLLVLGRYDPFSMIPWEGMASGIPTIVVKEGGVIEAVVNGKTGYLVKRNAKLIKEKIDLLLKNNNLYSNISENGYADVIKNWTWEKSAERLMNIVESYLI